MTLGSPAVSEDSMADTSGRLPSYGGKALKKGLKPADPDFIAGQFTKAIDKAKHAEDSGDKMGAHYAYAKIAQDFDGLQDVKEVTQKLTDFANQKIKKVP